MRQKDIDEIAQSLREMLAGRSSPDCILKDVEYLDTYLCKVSPTYRQSSQEWKEFYDGENAKDDEYDRRMNEEFGSDWPLLKITHTQEFKERMQEIRKSIYSEDETP